MYKQNAFANIPPTPFSPARYASTTTKNVTVRG